MAPLTIIYFLSISLYAFNSLSGHLRHPTTHTLHIPQPIRASPSPLLTAGLQVAMMTRCHGPRGPGV